MTKKGESSSPRLKVRVCFAISSPAIIVGVVFGFYVHRLDMYRMDYRRDSMEKAPALPSTLPIRYHRHEPHT